ncbi:MAG: tripartite tricarboxylate transporter permease [Granulosicoccus sp.]|nr:tripartite tricarboxylate transporter permease [Granulosicoccus sp.]
MTWIDYLLLGVQAVFQGPAGISIAGFSVSVAVLMVLAGFVLGIVVGSTPGLAGPMAMAISLPILISVFGYHADALLPVLGFLIGIMKGATVGGAVPAILFNTPGTPDAYMTTLDGHPMARRGQAMHALRVAHFSSASGDTFSDLVLIFSAPFLAVLVERYLDLPEKTALLLLSMTFIASVVGRSPGKGLIAVGLGLLAASVGTGEDFTPRLTFGSEALSQGFSVASAVLGVLIVGEVFKAMEDIRRDGLQKPIRTHTESSGSNRLSWPIIQSISPYIARSAVIGTIVGALPGIGSTLAATMGYTSGKLRRARRSPRDRQFGEGIPEGVAATEAANSSVSGANLIPVLSLGIPGNAAAVFLILATDTISGFNPGPSVFRMSAEVVNSELVIAFGLFTMMMIANLLNWCIGGRIMRAMGIMTRIPKHFLLPVILLLTLTAIYIQETRMAALWFTIGFGVLGYAMRRLDISPLPFVIAFILGGRLEESARQAFSATGSDPLFLFSSWTSTLLCIMCLIVPGLVMWRHHQQPAQ